MPRLLAAPDSFKGTCDAGSIAMAACEAASRAAWDCDRCPLSDGGEGFASVLSSLGGRILRTRVKGPLGAPVDASWRLASETAVIECAEACGLSLVNGVEGNDPIAASSSGVGELIAEALSRGARRIIVGLGGSATTDGGMGAVAEIEMAGGLRGAELLVACDVNTRFADAATLFAPQKGASPEQVAILSERLHDLAETYKARYGVDVSSLDGAGAAGGLGGGLAAVGGQLVPGADLVAEAVGLQERMRLADLVLTGEGRLDATSWKGKVVGKVVSLASASTPPVPVLVVAGSVAENAMSMAMGRIDLPEEDGWLQEGSGSELRAIGVPEVVSLVERFGEERALADPAGCVANVVRERLERGEPST